MRKMMFTLLAIAVTILVLAVIIAADRGALPPFIAVMYDFPYGDKAGHFILMGLLGLVISLALPLRWKVPGLLILSLGITVEEFSQKFFSRRTFSWIDLLASLSGILLFGGISTWLSYRRKRG